jgi:hypothetical protein
VHEGSWYESSNDRCQTDFVSTLSFHLTTIILSVQLTQIKLRGIPLAQISVLSTPCRLTFRSGGPNPSYSVRPEGAFHQWRKVPSRELSIDLVADERLGWVTDWVEAS